MEAPLTVPTLVGGRRVGLAMFGVVGDTPEGDGERPATQRHWHARVLFRKRKFMVSASIFREIPSLT